MDPRSREPRGQILHIFDGDTVLKAGANNRAAGRRRPVLKPGGMDPDPHPGEDHPGKVRTQITGLPIDVEGPLASPSTHPSSLSVHDRHRRRCLPAKASEAAIEGTRQRARGRTLFTALIDGGQDVPASGQAPGKRYCLLLVL